MCAFFAAAQPVIDEIDYRPVLGQSFISARSAAPLASNSEGPGGFQTWDLSDMNGQMTNTTNYWGPDQDFPGTTFRRLTNIFGTHHVKTTNDGWYSHGSMDWVFDEFHTIVYQDHLKLMAFPFTMGSSYTDTFSGTFSDIEATCSGTFTVEVDGYGSLITPAGSWTNVLRVRSVLTYTAVKSSGETENFNRESYEWYTEGIAHELAGIRYTTYPSGMLVISGLYLSSPLSINEEEAGKLVVFPNPAKDNTTIRLGSNENVTSVTAVDPLGKVHCLTFQQQQNELQIDVSGLADGIYYLGVKSGAESEKYVVLSVGGF